MPSPWINLPVSTTISGTFAGLPQTAGASDIQSYPFWNQFYTALEEKAEVLDCKNRFPPGNVIWSTGIIDGVTDNADVGPHTLILHFSGVDWHIPSGAVGPRWAGFRFLDPDLCGIPSNYDIVIEGDIADVYTVIRMQILANTYDAGTNTGTLTVNGDYLFNAITAKFIGPNATTWLTGKTANFMKQATGLWTTDRKPVKPNERESWKGTILNGYWNDATGEGTFQQVTEDFNPDPYNQPLFPLVNWKTDFWKNKEILFFDNNSKMYRKTILGNDKNRIVVGLSAFKLTTGGSTGGFKLTATVKGAPQETTLLAYNANSAAILAAINALTNLSASATISGAGPFVIKFAAGDDAVLLEVSTNTTGFPIALALPTSGTVSITGPFLVIYPGEKGMVGRNADPYFVWSQGLTINYISHDPNDQLVGAKKAYPIGVWQDLNSDAECVDYSHYCFDIDCQIEIYNTCECARAGDFLAPNLYKSWRMLQKSALGLLTSFVDIFNTLGDGKAFRTFTPATWALGYQTDSTINTTGANLHAWSTGISVDITTHIVTVASTNSMPYYPISVHYSILDDHEGIATYGETTMSVTGELGITADPSWDGRTIVLWPGFSRFYRRRVKYIYPATRWIGDSDLDLGVIDPPAITPGGHIDSPTNIKLVSIATGGTLNYNTTYSYRISALNGSGEMIPTTASTIKASVCTKVCASPPCPPGTLSTVCQTANTYSIKISWDAVIGASNYAIYGNSGGSEGLLGTVSDPVTTFIDDGSFSPGMAPPTTNTTHNDCFGRGMWIKRGTSTNYATRGSFGAAIESGPAFISDEIAAYMGDNFQDAFDGRGGVRSSFLPDAYLWDHFFRGTRLKPYELLRNLSRRGRTSFGTKWSFTDEDKNWWSDTVNTGYVRYQGGVATGGDATSLTDSTYNAGDKSCWWNVTAFINLGGQWGEFILQVCAGGLPEGWAVAADGTATYTEPNPVHAGTFTSGAPTISSTRPSIPIADGLTHTLVIVGNNFSPSCTVKIIDTVHAVTYNNVATTSITPGAIVLSFAFPSGGAWTVTVTNPTALDSNVQSITVQASFKVPITAGASGILTFAAISGFAAAGGDGYLIAEPAGYELNKWQGHRVRITKTDGTTLKLQILNSDKNTLYFALQSFTFDPNWSYEIIEHMPSEKFKFRTTAPSDARDFVKAGPSTYWVDPAGDSDTRSGTNHPFLKNQKANLETKVVDYGLYMSMDDIGPHIFNELYYMIRSMRWTVGNAECYLPDGELNFTADQVMYYNGLHEDYSFDGGITIYKGAEYGPGPSAFGAGPNPPYPPGPAGTSRSYNDSWGGSAAYYASRGGTGNIREAHESSQSGCPFTAVSISVGASLGPGVPHWMGLCMVSTIQDQGQYSYMQDSQIPTCFNSVIDIYGFGWFDSSDSPIGIVEDWPDNPVHPGYEENVFDAQGTGLLWHTWSVIDTLPLGNSDIRLGTNKIGLDPISPPMLQQPPDPLPHQSDDGTVSAADTGSAYTTGYWLGDKKAVRRWDVSGGMIYL